MQEYTYAVTVDGVQIDGNRPLDIALAMAEAVLTANHSMAVTITSEQQILTEV